MKEETMEEKKQEAIVLLNDGEQSDQEGRSNSWPLITYPYLPVTTCDL